MPSKDYDTEMSAITDLKLIKRYLTDITLLAGRLLKTSVFDRSLMHLQDDVDDVDKLYEMKDCSQCMLDDIKLIVSKFDRFHGLDMLDDDTDAPGYFLHLAEFYDPDDDSEDESGY